MHLTSFATLNVCEYKAGGRKLSKMLGCSTLLKTFIDRVTVIIHRHFRSDGGGYVCLRTCDVWMSSKTGISYDRLSDETCGAAGAFSEPQTIQAAFGTFSVAWREGGGGSASMSMEGKGNCPTFPNS